MKHSRGMVGVVALAAIVMAIGLGLPRADDAAAAKTMSCAPANRIGSDHLSAYGITARNMACPEARSAIETGRLISRGNLRTRGWSCRVVHRAAIGKIVNGATDHCTRRGSAFQFSWAT